MEFVTKDMTCGGCVSAIRRAIGEIDPAAQVEADLEKHLVKVSSEKPREVVAGAIEGAGFRIDA